MSTKQNNFLLDNLFFDGAHGELCGVKRENIKYKPNFLNTVDSDDCTALISFSLHSVGKSQGGLNLYLKPLKDFPIYCTNIESVKKLPNAKQYLEEMMYNTNDNNNICQNLREKFKRRIPTLVFNNNNSNCNESCSKTNNKQDVENKIKRKKIDKEEEKEEEKEKEDDNSDTNDEKYMNYQQDIDNILNDLNE